MATDGLRGDEYRASRLGASTRGSVLWVGGVLLGSEFGVSVGFEGGARPGQRSKCGSWHSRRHWGSHRSVLVPGAPSRQKIGAKTEPWAR